MTRQILNKPQTLLVTVRLMVPHYPGGVEVSYDVSPHGSSTDLSGGKKITLVLEIAGPLAETGALTHQPPLLQGTRGPPTPRCPAKGPDSWRAAPPREPPTRGVKGAVPAARPHRSGGSGGVGEEDGGDEANPRPPRAGLPPSPGRGLPSCRPPPAPPRAAP